MGGPARAHQVGVVQASPHRQVVDDGEAQTPLHGPDEPVDELPTPIERFLEAYRSEILDELRTGPVSLSDAVNKGWLQIDDVDLLPQLVGVYASPDWLDETNDDLAVSIAPGSLDMPLPDGGRLEGDDLVLHWLAADSTIKED